MNSCVQSHHMGNYKLKELLRWRRPKQHGHLRVAPRRRRLDRAETLNLKVWALEIRHQKVTEKSIEGKGNKMKITKTQLRKVIKEELTRGAKADIPHGWAQVLPWLAEESTHDEPKPHRQRSKMHEEEEPMIGDAMIGDDDSLKLKYTDDIEALLNSYYDELEAGGMGPEAAQLKLQQMIDTLAMHSRQGFIGMPT